METELCVDADLQLFIDRAIVPALLDRFLVAARRVSQEPAPAPALPKNQKAA